MISKLISVLLLITTFHVLAETQPASITPQVVYFDGKSFPVSPLKKRIAKLKGLELKPVTPDRLSGLLYKPEFEGKHPAIIMVHDCRGIQAYQKQWAQLVAGWGYVVLFLDSFTTRKIDSTCQGLGEQENYLIHGGRVQDVFAAYDFLKQQEFVENFRIGLMGWDYHSVLGAVAKHGMQQKFNAKFMGTVAIYPSCNATSGTEFLSPILVLAGELDDWTPAEECRIMEGYARSGVESVQVRYFKDAKHGFDDPSTVEEIYYPDFRNYFKSPARGVTMQYNEYAHQASIKVVRQFIDFNIKHRPIQITLDDLPGEFTRQQIETAAWVDHPDAHGSDIPELDYSLFDRVFSVKTNNRWHHDIPFPFDKLLIRLREFVDHSETGVSKLKSVLIPSGRSLVRNAAAPDFFKFPRIVVAIDTEPPLENGQYALLLKDRMYIAYQEKAKALEVISYNESLQRFEFQIVKNYSHGQTPEVQYANRSLCLSCHQNHAPIFANAPWDETNFNEQVFKKIKQQRQNFYGLIPAVPVASSANSIDRSTNRATLLPIYNALWNQGCAAQDNKQAIYCRAEIFKAMLQYRLSNKVGFERNQLTYRENFIHTATLAWMDNWPNGLAVPAANITDRNPFTEKMEVSAKFDPLTPRPPQTIWHGSNARHMEQVIYGLGDQIYKSEIKTLDEELLNRHTAVTDTVRYTNDCLIQKTKVQADRLTASIQCNNRNRTEENNFDLNGRLIFDLNSRSVSGEFKSLKRADEFILYDIKFKQAKLNAAANQITVKFTGRHKNSPLSLRLPSGDSVKSFTLVLKTDSLDKTTDNLKADLSFKVLKDFDLIDQAIQALRAESINADSQLFFEQPFIAHRYITRLFRQLGKNNPNTGCCRELPEGLPKKTFNIDTLMAGKSLDIDNASATELILAICSTCHRTDESFPPNFLAGNAEQIQRNLSQCAPRIAYRLQMWNTSQGQRKKTPMPPTPPQLNEFKFDTQQWQTSTIIKRIKDFVLGLIDSPYQDEQLMTELMKTPYESLQECEHSTISTSAQTGIE